MFHKLLKLWHHCHKFQKVFSHVKRSIYIMLFICRFVYFIKKLQNKRNSSEIVRVTFILIKTTYIVNKIEMMIFFFLLFISNCKFKNQILMVKKKQKK